jgi:hypothetical protein
MHEGKHQHKRGDVVGLRLGLRLSTSEIARQTGVPLGTTYRWLAPYPLTDEEKTKNLSNAIKAIIRPPARGRDRASKLAYQRKWYKGHLERQKSWNRSRRLDLTVWYQSLKSGLKCCMCPENHPACIEFHHRNPDDKETEISTAIRYGWSRDRILGSGAV